MLDQAFAPATQHCVWMNAGLLSYRLCNRGFDCEHCLLDAAMRGEFLGGGTASATRAWPVGLVPEDRLYSAGHTWVQALPGDARVWRLGLDAFAAAIIGAVTEVRLGNPLPLLHLGDPACQIDTGIGTVSLTAPFPCRIVRRNDALRQHPEQVIAEPYDEGWILELAVTDLNELVGLASPETARNRIGCDWCRFCQSVALQLLSSSGITGWAAVLHHQPVADVRVLLGAPRYIELLREFVH